jgi:hypothetical protein
MRPDPTDVAIARCLFAFLTIMIAFTIGYVSHYDMGFSEEDIRDVALFGSSIVGVLLALEYFGGRHRKPK